MGLRNFIAKFERYRKADLTTVPMWKAIAWLTVPTLAGNAVQNAFNVIIMYYVSRLGTAAIAAVSVAGVVSMLVFTAIIGLSVGTTALVARYHGARDEDCLRRAMNTTLAFSLALAVIMAAAGLAAGKPLLHTLGAEADVVDLAYSYLHIFFLGGIGFILLMMISAILRGLGDAVTPTVIVAVTVTLDVLIEPVFIFGLGPAPRLGVPGAALGAVCAFAIGATLAVVALTRNRLRWCDIRAANLSGRLGWQLISIGVPASAQMLIRVIAQMVLVGFVTVGGTVAVAAYGIGNQLTFLILIPCFALAMSAAILVGQNLGAGKTAQAERAAMTSVGIAAAIAGAMIIALVAFARPIVEIFDTTPAVVALGTKFIYIAAPAYIAVPFGMVLSRAMGGAGVSWPPLLVTAAVLLGVRIPLAYLLTHTFGMGVEGVFWAVSIPTLLEGLAMFAVFKTGVWKHKKL